MYVSLTCKYELDVLTPIIKHLNYKLLQCIFRLTITQLVIGVVTVILHIISTAINDDFNTQVLQIQNKLKVYFIDLEYYMDYAATGIWTGMVVGLYLLCNELLYRLLLCTTIFPAMNTSTVSTVLGSIWLDQS